MSGTVDKTKLFQHFTYNYLHYFQLALCDKVYIYMYVCMYVCMHICIYAYIYVYNLHFFRFFCEKVSIVIWISSYEKYVYL